MLSVNGSGVRQIFQRDPLGITVSLGLVLAGIIHFAATYLDVAVYILIMIVALVSIRYVAISTVSQTTKVGVISALALASQIVFVVGHFL